MPYTPPSSHTPVGSRIHTPALSRSQSYNKSHQRDSNANLASNASPPYSSSKFYLQKHRRSPSASQSPPFQPRPATPDATPDDTASPESEESQNEHPQAQGARSSSPAVTKGAAISPPDSSQNSSDDEPNTRRGRVKDPDNLAELQAAISIIEQHRASSPNRVSSEVTKQARMTLGLPDPRLDPHLKDKVFFSPRPPLSAEARKISHSRSSTDASAFADFPRNKFDSPTKTPSDTNFEEVDAEDIREKPALVRKKSGEPVRPALRPRTARRRPSSMPGTPTYSKAVHFNSDLEQVRTFLQVDRPLAVSAGSSPVQAYESEIEFPFGRSELESHTPSFEWEIRLTNFPCDSLERLSMPVRVERAYLSPDNKNLLGAIAVQNIAFHKLVVARFTLDYWKTTSEVKADFNNDVRRKQANDGYDRFIFSIKLEDQANLENKTMFFCVRYNVNGQEFWDNNNSINYQVDFSKKARPMNCKNGMQGAAARPLDSLPRSKPSTSAPARPRSFPSKASDDFASSFAAPFEFSSFPQPSAQLVGESPIRFKKSSKPLLPDAPGRRTTPAGQAFGSRYDFGASLSAAIQSASSNIGERNGIQNKQEIKSAPAKQPTFSVHVASDPSTGDPFPKNPPQPENTSVSSSSEKPRNKMDSDTAKPVALTAEKPSVQSSSYNELLDKYCFVRSRPHSEGKELLH